MAGDQKDTQEDETDVQPGRAETGAELEQPIEVAIPKHAHERMKLMHERRFFTSDLSVPEFLLVKEAGFDPVGMVMGSSIYHIGWQRSNWSKNQELTVLSSAMYHARELAMERMEEEANELGADGIIGVRLDAKLHAWSEHVCEFVAVGTAVVSRDGVSHRTHKDRPFTSDLSGEEFWKLIKSGYRPVGFVMGNCVYHVARQGLAQWRLSLTGNQEMLQYTQALYDARELAMERMVDEAEELKAEGIVGVNIEEKSHVWGSHIIEFFALGTAVVKRTVAGGAEASDETPGPVMIIPLND
jgi:uncharacterized protein YbjQ (UPF0145 family)